MANKALFLVVLASMGMSVFAKDAPRTAARKNSPLQAVGTHEASIASLRTNASKYSFSE